MSRKSSSRPSGGREKSLALRIAVIVLTAALFAGIIILPLAMSASAEEDGSAVTVESFATGKLADALLEAANGTDYNFIKKAAVLSGTMSEADFGALLSIPNLEYIELAGTEADGGIIPENAIPSRNQLKYISLPKNTREIGKGAFSGNRKLEKISMPDTVSVIGDYAFDACESLSSVPVTSNVTYIGEGAFRDCKSLTSFTIPAGITEIYDYTFSKCGFSEIIIGPDVVSVGDGAFADCGNLRDIYSYAETAPSIPGPDAFRNVSASIHVYKDCGESYRSWEGNNIKAIEDLTGDYPVEAPSAQPAPAEAAPDEPAETEAPASPQPEAAAKPEETAPEAAPAAAPASQEAPAQTSGGLSVGVVVVIVIMAVIIAVLATVIVMMKKNGSGK